MRNIRILGRAARATGLAAALVLGAGIAPLALGQQDAGSRYAQVLADADSLARYNIQLEHNLKLQQSRLLGVQEEIAGLDQTGADVQPLLVRMFQELDSFIAADLPFIDPSQASDDHRAERMAKLRELMADETANAGEKFRRIMEACQIEIEYGRTMASYKAKLADGREANYVRVGRISLMYRTVDGEETAYWDAQQKQWIVDNDYADAVELAIHIATKLKAPDLVEVPVPAATEVRS